MEDGMYVSNDEPVYVSNVASEPEALPLPTMEFDLPTANTSKRQKRTQVLPPSEPRGLAVLPTTKMEFDEEDR